MLFSLPLPTTLLLLTLFLSLSLCVNLIPTRDSSQNEVYFEDDQCVVVYDAYPKSKHHLLLLPKPKVKGALVPPPPPLPEVSKRQNSVPAPPSTAGVLGMLLSIERLVSMG